MYLVKVVRKWTKALDMLLLLGAGIVVSGVGAITFWIADSYNATSCVLAVCAAAGFFLIIGKTYGIKKLKILPFATFSIVWLLVHVCVFLLVLGYLGFVYYPPFLVAELFVGFMAATWLFGTPASGPS